MKNRFILKYTFSILLFWILLLFTNCVYSQKYSKGVTNAVENYLRKDTSNHKFIELSNNKLYLLDSIETVVYKGISTSIYVFGSGDSHAYYNLLLFIQSKNENSYFIIGDEKNLEESIWALNTHFVHIDKMSGIGINKCYNTIINNWDRNVTHKSQTVPLPPKSNTNPKNESKKKK